ncbi:hypothetical protein AVEN_204174-1 [Araneus ventricosus]|uniref:Uncharacterized protein n=1 Tax=Araneus ventricosus TaxID=182803 RepID=A0A4Y2G5I5_ARAVE|nr:hypothetical protein AVEN_204174-1 [Araneus ventricosus]
MIKIIDLHQPGPLKGIAVGLFETTREMRSTELPKRPQTYNRLKQNTLGFCSLLLSILKSLYNDKPAFEVKPLYNDSAYNNKPVIPVKRLYNGTVYNDKLAFAVKPLYNDTAYNDKTAFAVKPLYNDTVYNDKPAFAVKPLYNGTVYNDKLAFAVKPPFKDTVYNDKPALEGWYSTISFFFFENDTT